MVPDFWSNTPLDIAVKVFFHREKDWGTPRKREFCLQTFLALVPQHQLFPERLAYLPDL